MNRKPHIELKWYLMKIWETPLGYPKGIKQKLASDINENTKTGSRQGYQIDPGVYTRTTKKIIGQFLNSW